ncbi:MAG: class I SAM-dependent methyltransferase [Anaerolineae bacterium]|nr:class I SAM-dependent methyltransferase [Chloroflexota bacterium]
MTAEPSNRPQVERAHYFTAAYLSPARLAAYSYQLREVLTLKPDSVLEVGVGGGLTLHTLRCAGITAYGIDLDSALGPDVVATVLELPWASESCDVVACFEVLEHLPWEMLRPALLELHRVCRRHALISLPDASRVLRVHLSRLLERKQIPLRFIPARPHVFDGQHYWEIGKRGYDLERVSVAMQEVGFVLEHTFRPWEDVSQRFFCLRKVRG